MQFVSGRKLSLVFAITSQMLFWGGVGASLFGAQVSGPQSGAWTLASSPYIVSGDVVVPQNQTLTIEPGVIVQFAGPFSITVEGAMKAVGTSTNRIVFTSKNDNDFTYNATADGAKPSATDWQGIVFGDNINKENCEVRNVVVRYCRLPFTVGKRFPAALQNILIMNAESPNILVNGRPVDYQSNIDSNFSPVAVEQAPSSSPVPNRVAQQEPTTSQTETQVFEDDGDDESSEDFSFGEIGTDDFSLSLLKIFGYFSTRFEKVFNEPTLENGQTVRVGAPAEFGYPFFNLMMEHQLSSRFKVFINLNGADAENVDVRNFWGEYAASSALNFRIGKIYRKFGLYNEILDAVPSYYGIEPPELFDGDHLMISRTTALMVYGSIDPGNGLINYSVSTDNGEGGPVEDRFPIGFDVNYVFRNGDFKLGISGYNSNGDAVPDKGVGEGSPNSGVLPWMATDRFNVFGGYAEGRFGNLTLQGEVWNSHHEAVRDPASVLQVINGAGLSQRQLGRFLTDPTGEAVLSNVATNAEYDVKTWYLRGGYSFDTAYGEFGPYVQFDNYNNPETIASKTFGGDNEAGITDDGKFQKLTVGFLLRPIPQVAVKFDGSSHIQNFNGERISYEEVRLDISFVFGRIF